MNPVRKILNIHNLNVGDKVIKKLEFPRKFLKFSNGMKRWSNFLFLFLFSLFFFVPAFSYSANATSTVTFHIRHQEALVFEGTMILGEPQSILIKDNKGIDRKATSTSVLAVLLEIDKNESSFEVSDLVFFESFDSFFINCIQIVVKNLNACSNWQYAVNGVLPSIGTDRYLLKNKDDVYLFFGNTHQVVLDRERVSPGEQFTAVAQNYVYSVNVWEPLGNVTIGVVQDNPNDPFSPIVIATSTASSAGTATFTLGTPGLYKVGIAEDFYFPTVSLTVATSTSSGGGGGGGFAPTAHYTLNIDKAIQFLASQQKSDGSFATAPLFSDWVAVAFGAYQGENSAKEKLKAYLLTDPSPGTLATDYERRAMALMALRVDPYSGTRTDYIQKVLDNFDGTQFGSPDLINDDIFALFPLLKAGFSAEDVAVKNAFQTVLSSQKPDGSWLGGVDMTAAAVQALSLVPSFDGASQAVQKAKVYLKSQQNSSGGFDSNVFSTSWAMQAIGALREREEDWEKSGKTPGDFLFANQLQDGGIKVEGDGALRIWATAYAIPAGLQKTWGEILFSFSKQEAGGGVIAKEITPKKETVPKESILPQKEPQEEKREVSLPISVVSEKTTPVERQPALRVTPSPRPLAEKNLPPTNSLEAQSTEKTVRTSKPQVSQQLASPASATKNTAKQIFFVGAALSLILIAYLVFQFILL